MRYTKLLSTPADTHPSNVDVLAVLASAHTRVLVPHNNHFRSCRSHPRWPHPVMHIHFHLQVRHLSHLPRYAILPNHRPFHPTSHPVSRIDPPMALPLPNLCRPHGRFYSCMSLVFPHADVQATHAHLVATFG